MHATLFNSFPSADLFQHHLGAGKTSDEAKPGGSWAALAQVPPLVSTARGAAGESHAALVPCS